MYTAGASSALLRDFRLALTVERLRPHTIHGYLGAISPRFLTQKRAERAGLAMPSPHPEHVKGSLPHPSTAR